jgi:hypothetical protein
VSVQVRYQNKSEIVAVGGKIVAVTKRSASESIKCEGAERFFFIGRASFIMSLSHMV